MLCTMIEVLDYIWKLSLELLYIYIAVCLIKGVDVGMEVKQVIVFLVLIWKYTVLYW